MDRGAWQVEVCSVTSSQTQLKQLSTCTRTHTHTHTTLMAENEEELKSLLMKVKEEREKAGLKFNILKTKIMVSSSITPWQIDGETVRDFYFLGLHNHCRW